MRRTRRTRRDERAGCDEGAAEIRRRLHLTQAQFAARFGLPLSTLRDWEQGAREPDSAARTLLRVIEREPDAVVRALEG